LSFVEDIMMEKRLSFTVMSSIVVAVGLASAGCHGTVVEPSGPTRNGGVNGSGSGSSPGGTPNPVNGMKGGTCNVAPAPVQRLTKLDYNNVIRDLFGVQKDYAAGFSADAEGPAGFTTEGVAQNLALSHVTDYLNAAKAVVADVFAASPNRLLTCTSGDACAQSIITSLATKAPSPCRVMTRPLQRPAKAPTART